MQDGPESPHPNLFASMQTAAGAEEDRAIGTRVMGHPSGTLRLGNQLDVLWGRNQKSHNFTFTIVS